MCQTLDSTTTLGVAITQCTESFITAISSSEGTSLDPITVVGTGLTDQDCVSIQVRDKPCVIQTFTTAAGVTTITCVLDATAVESDPPLAVGPQHQIQVGSS